MAFRAAELKKLKNGTRVILVPSLDTQAVTVTVSFAVGSRYETPKLEGASHYIEHMMFKGTKRRSAQDISRALDAVGADFNAFTGKDHTSYYIRLAADHAELAVDMLHDMIFNSTYPKEECERERKVILEEINMYEDSPPSKAGELLELARFGDTPLGRPIAGTHVTMNGITREALIRYRDAYYVPSCMIVTIAGRVDERIMPLLERTFGRVRQPSRKPPEFHKARFTLGKPLLKMGFKETEQAQFCLSFPSQRFGHPNEASTRLLSTILGGGMSSRLFTQVRERRGLAYSVSTSESPYQDVGSFEVYAGLSKPKFEEGIKVILSELSKVAAHGVTKHELEDAKEHKKGQLILRLESPAALADFYANQQLLLGKMKTPDEWFSRIEAVTRDDVKSAAKAMFRTSNIAASIVGPYKDPKPFMKLLKV